MNKSSAHKARAKESSHSKPSTQSDIVKGAVLGQAAAAASMPEPTTTIAGLVVEADALRATLKLDVRGSGRLRSYTLQAPSRVIVEGEGLRFAPELAALALPQGGLITDFRFGAVDSREGRIVFELARSTRVTALQYAEGTVSVTLQVSGLAQGADEAHTLDLSQPAATSTKDAAPTWATATTAAPDATSKRRPVIFLDPGHGGRDPGAVTSSGIHEKDVVLAVGLRLQAALMASGRYDVRMTRETDASVTLDRRLDMSRQAHADLFVSLHADTFAGAQARGGAVYILSEQATSRMAAALADKENAADQRLGAELPTSSGDAAVDNILNDLTTRETGVFARSLQSGLVGALKGKMVLARDPARGAAFKVLRQVGTPAVLIELGYLSHADDVALLQSPQWQSGVVAAITRAIDGYFGGGRATVVGR